MFGSEVLRLLRSKWKSPWALAQEIYAILSSDDLPLDHAGPLTLSPPTNGQPAITFRGFGPDDTVFQIRHPDGTTGMTLTGGTLNFNGTPAVNQGVAPIDLGTSNLDGSYNAGTYGNLPANAVGVIPLLPGSPGSGFTAPGFPTPTPDTQPQNPQSPGGGIPCKITSGGPGSSYTATLYLLGPTVAGITATVIQLDIDSAATIAPNTWGFASSVNGQYYVQVPVWGADLS